ncbi:kelch domain-containing protein 7B-like [Hyperolius riggenbachi]|uniref:kelch domain-containing protein 7B-like n=1 Tax=Hyperolius riggenbachi TaxID=752182 RepID=UPI0035A30088
MDDVSFSREKVMSTIAENPELIFPKYKSTTVKKLPLMARSCDNILSGESHQRFTLKNKARSMLCLLTEYYSSKLTSSENEPVEEVARGSFIRIPKGLQNLGEAMRFQLTLGNCLELLNLARKNSVPELLKAVYTVISDNYLNVLKNTAVYGQLTFTERERVLQLRMRGRSSLCVVEMKSIFGLNKNVRYSVETAECKTQLLSLDMETNQWKPLTNIPEEACLKGCSICSMHNYLFIAGGLQKNMDGSSCSNKLFCYNPLTDIWTPLSPMIEGRSQLRLIPLDGYLYAVGGECLHTVEKYDPRTNKWTFVAPLPKGSFAVAHEAVACGGEIYISGGHLFYRLFKYNPVHDEWAECPFNASKGRSCDMVSVGNILYRFDMLKDSSVNILKYNTVAKMWSEYTAIFPGSKIPFRCALLDGSIYCLNRETTAKFLMEGDKPEFEAHVFSKVPMRCGGSPHPIVLCLPGTISQTSV